MNPPNRLQWLPGCRHKDSSELSLMDMTHEDLIAKALEHLVVADVDTSKLKNGRVIEAAVVYFDSGTDTKTVEVTMDRTSGECIGATIADENVLKR